MKKNIFRLLCVTLLAGMAFVSCERENITSGKHTVTVTSANEQMGKAYGGGQFDAGSTVRIWGTPEIGYQFDRWNDGNTDNPRNIIVSGDVTYTAYFKAVGSDPDTNGGGGGGETPGQFTATVVVDGTPYSGIALVSTGQSDNLFNLAVFIGEQGPAFVTYILPRSGNQSISDGIQCFFYGSESDFVETSQGTFPPYLTVPSAGCIYDVNVTALDINAQTVTLSASGTMLDIAANEAGQPRLVSFMVSIDGSFQYPGTPSK